MDATAERAPRRGKVVLACLVLLVAALATWMLWPVGRPARTLRTTGRNHVQATEPQTEAEATPAASAVEAPEAPAEVWETVRLVVRDLWSCDPLPGLDLRVVPPHGDERELRTDAGGAIEVDAAVLDDATTWSCAVGPHRIASSAARIRRDREIWCYRIGVVQGRVALRAGLPAALVVPLPSVSLSFSPERVSAAAEGRDAWTWLARANGIPVELQPPLEDGSFRVEVPALRNGALVARLAGFRPAWQVLDEASLRGEREVVLVLEPGMRIGGSLRNETGVPLAGVPMMVGVVIRMRSDDADIEAIGRMKDWGYTVARKGDETVCTLLYQARTDGQGRWETEVDADGELVVVAYPEGHAAVDRQAGQASRLAATTGLELVARRDTGAAILVYRNGRQLASTVVEFCDLSLPGLQPVFRVETDADGTLQSPWLVEGKRYGLEPEGEPPMVFWHFTGQSRLDLETCEKDVGRFLGGEE